MLESYFRLFKHWQTIITFSVITFPVATANRKCNNRKCNTFYKTCIKEGLGQNRLD